MAAPKSVRLAAAVWGLATFVALGVIACGCSSTGKPAGNAASCGPFASYVSSLADSRGHADAQAIAAERAAFHAAGNPTDAPGFVAAVEGEANNSDARRSGYSTWSTSGCGHGDPGALLTCVKAAASRAQVRMSDERFASQVIASPPEPPQPPDISEIHYAALVQTDIARRRTTDTSELIFQAAGSCVRESILGDPLSPPAVSGSAADVQCAESSPIGAGVPRACGSG